MKLIYSRNAVKAIRKLREPYKSRIKNAILSLPSGDIKPLQGSDGRYRLRIGNYRVLFYKIDGGYQIYKIAKREDAYKKEY